MQAQALFGLVKAVCFLVLFLMVVAIGYASVIGLGYWSGIGV